MKADLISRERKWNLKHDESFSFFFFLAMLLPLASVYCELAGKISII